MNPLLSTDSYALGHYLQYPPNMTSSYFYLSHRSPEPIVFFGLQQLLKELRVPTMKEVHEAAKIAYHHGLPFNQKGFERISMYEYWPIYIHAIPEGTIVPANMPMLTIESDLEPWAPSYLEALLVQLWYPCTVATKSRRIYQAIKQEMELSCDTLDGLPYMLHDFGVRGVGSMETAAIGGLAHLTSFEGTDNLPAIELARNAYSCSMAGKSIMAMNHATCMAWGKENEAAAFIGTAKHGLPASYITDTYDMPAALDKCIGLPRNSLIVIRLDSGDPFKTVPYALRRLHRSVPWRLNSKGLIVFNNHKVLQGDGVDESTIRLILANARLNGFSADNLVFGMGGELLQKCNRDTHGFNMKLSAVRLDDTWHEVHKEAPGKTSLAGRFNLPAVEPTTLSQIRNLIESQNRQS